MSGRSFWEEKKILNKEQLEAVQHGEGPLLVIAGAGTGKTTVVAERIKYLISHNRVKPTEILALTFTEKAAREMEERIDLVLPLGYTQTWISTFHSFGDRILRQEALNIGLDPHFVLLTTADAHLFIKRNLFEFDLDYFRPHGNPTKFIGGMLQHFSRLKDEDIGPEEYLEYAQKKEREAETAEEKEEAKKTLELARAYQKYEELKIKNSLMDFSDLIFNTLKLFRARPSILRKYQRQFKYILVDEFQDTNIAQYELLKILAPPEKKPNLTVVGDDNQSIYKFRGAAVSNILQFMEEYPGAKKVVLTKNYRSTQTILDRAYFLIKHNDPDTLEAKLGISKNLVAVKNRKSYPVRFFHLPRVEDEAETVAREIRRLTVETKKYHFRDIAILVRANAHSEPFTRTLHRFGIPYQFLGPGMLFRQPEIKELIAYLKVLYDLSDDVALYSVLGMEHFDIHPKDLANLVSFARKYNLSLFEACEAVLSSNRRRPSLTENTRLSLKKIVEMINRHLRLLPRETAGQILYYFLEDSGMLRKLANYKTPLEEKKALNISKFFDKLKSYEIEHQDAGVYAVCDWLDLSLEMGESPLASDLDWTENNAVNILTVHSAKGLEFPVVFLVNLVAQRFPTRERREQIPIPEELIKEILPQGDAHLQEERRLFYVGMTRAGDRLYLTAAKYYGEGKLKRKVSPFVYETLGGKLPQETKFEQLGLLNWPRLILSPQREQVVSRRLNYLSYSQIETFLRCPRQFKYRYLLKIPTPPSSAASFGTSIHLALKDFYRQVVAGKKPEEKDLISFLERNWQREGYASRTHEEKSFQEAKGILSLFYQKAFSPTQRPIGLEERFVLKLSPDLKIGGKMDRIDQLAEGKIEIIDYKTGKVMGQKEVDRNLQLTIYAMAATSPGIYNKPPEKIVLSFYFLSEQKKVVTFRRKRQLLEAKQMLLSLSEEIRQSEFLPRPGKYCDFCEYKLLCEGWR